MLLLQAPAAALPSAKELGQAIATLHDFNLIIWALLVVMVIMASERIVAAWGMRVERREMRIERERMWAVADKFGIAAQEIGDQTDKLVVELQVLRSLASRVESSADGRK